MTLTSDNEMEEIAVFHREGVPIAETGRSQDRGTCAFPHRRAKTWTRLYFRTELLVAVSQVEETAEVTVDPETEVEKIAVAVTSEPPNKTPPQLSIK